MITSRNLVKSLGENSLVFEEACIFCSISQKRAPASIVFEDKVVVAFLDIRPLNLGHCLVIPKEHWVDIFDIPNDVFCQVHQATKPVAVAVKKATNADGVSIIQQNGKAAGQDIYHFHVHVVPRFVGQKLPLFSEILPVERAKLDEMALRIRENL